MNQAQFLASKKDDDEDDEPEPDYVEKKAEHPFKLLDKAQPSPFVMDTWKKTYSNCTDYHEAMDAFWASFDANGWSIFRGERCCCMRMSAWSSTVLRTLLL